MGIWQSQVIRFGACMAVALLDVFIGPLAQAQERAPPRETRISFERLTASAGLFANLWHSAGSVTYESRRAVTTVESAVASAKPPAKFCSQSVASPPQPVIYLSSIPHRFLSNQPDSSYCQSKLSSTTLKPLVFQHSGFQSQDEVMEWMSNLGRGKGPDGLALYTSCNATCSPQYFYVIARSTTDNSYTVRAEVVCGLTRDKRDNQYDLDFGLLWKCGR